MDTPDLTRAQWHTSTYSGSNGSCIEVARNLPGIAAVRDAPPKRRDRRTGTRLRVPPRVALPGGTHRGWRRRGGAIGLAGQDRRGLPGMAPPPVKVRMLLSRSRTPEPPDRGAARRYWHGTTSRVK